jgi:hypothetical protein
LERELKYLHSCIQELEAEIDELKALDKEELKALDKEELKKLATMEEVEALQGNICNLEGQLDFERG